MQFLKYNEATLLKMNKVVLRKIARDNGIDMDFVARTSHEGLVKMILKRRASYVSKMSIKEKMDIADHEILQLRAAYEQLRAVHEMMKQDKDKEIDILTRIIIHILAYHPVKFDLGKEDK